MLVDSQKIKIRTRTYGDEQINQILGFLASYVFRNTAPRLWNWLHLEIVDATKARGVSKTQSAIINTAIEEELR